MRNLQTPKCWPRKGRNLLALLVTLFVLIAAEGRAQSALDGFDPNANGQVRVVVVQPDGKILLGGDFTTLAPNGGGPVTRNHIARLNSDGTLDSAFNPSANSSVHAIVVQADGDIVVGGAFGSIGGQTRAFIARLDGVTGLADSFNPSANNTVYSVAAQAAGQILAGGVFTGIGGQSRNRIARLDAATGLADSFNPNASDDVLAIVAQADGSILVGGFFNGANSIGGQTRNFMARLDGTTGGADSFNPNANGFVASIAVQADGRILTGGTFTTIGGQIRNFIARLDGTTGLADSFNPGVNNIVNSIVVQADGRIVAGGAFTIISGQGRGHIARFNATTGLVDSFNPNASDNVLSIAVQADGKILAGGLFTTLAPNGGPAVTRNNIARLETDGRLDQTLDSRIVGEYVLATAVQPDGKILIGGSFTEVGGVARNNIARLNTDGTLDTVFNPNANSDIYAIALQPDGRILAAGNFSGANSIGGQTRNRIARLDATTGVADSFDPNANGIVLTIMQQADGKILVGGQFNGANSIGGQPRNRIARLDATTGAADSFDPNANSNVLSIAVQADGKILAGGDFAGASGIGGQTRNRIARLDATTGLADSFDPNANSTVNPIAVQPDGKVLAGGNFFGVNSIGGQTRNRIARLDATTGLADSFDPNANNIIDSIALQTDGRILTSGDFNGVNSIGGQARNRVARLDATTGSADAFDPNADSTGSSITVQADGRVLAGGFFTTIGGQPRSRFARLSNDTAALQNLAVTQNTITWTRGGSSPQLTRVTFESSTDNVSFAPLGNGTAVGSNWTLMGLSFPTGQTFYIRARGYYRSGYLNGSESITESVRNAFIAGPTPTPAPTGTPAPTATPTPAVLTLIDQFNPGIGQLVSCDFDNTSGNVWVYGGSATILRRYSTTGTFLSSVTRPGEAANDVDIEFAPEPLTLGSTSIPAGTLLFVNGETDFADIYAVDKVTGAVLATLNTSFGASHVVGGAYHPGRDTFFLVQDGVPGGTNGNRIAEISAATGSVLNTFQVPFSISFGDIEISAVTGNLLVVSSNEPRVLELTPAGVLVQYLALPVGPVSLSGIGLDDSLGEAWVSSTNGLVYHLGGFPAVPPTPTPTPGPPVILSPLGTSARVGQPFVYQFVATGATSLDVSNLAPGLTFNTNLAAIIGTPTTAGTTQVALSASNTIGTTKATLTINVQPPPVSGPEIQSSTAVTGRVGQLFTFQVFTIGGTPAARISASGLPAGLSIDAVSGRISGIVSVAGSWAVMLTVTDGPATASSILQLTFSADPGLPVVISPGAAALTPGQFFSYTINAPTNAGPNDPTLFTLIGNLPGGLSFNASTGVISGTYNPLLRGGQMNPNLAGGTLLGSVQLFASNSHGTATFQLLFLAAPSGAVNISTRLQIGTGENVLIGGFIVTGNAPKVVIIRALGPSTQIAGALEDPTLELHDSAGNVVVNDNWRSNQEQIILSTTIPPGSDLESALVAGLDPGAYTAIVKGKKGATGVGLVEVYDLGTASLDVSGNARLAQISTRGTVLSGDSVMIGGFIISGEATNVIVRAIGPSLTQFGITGALADPTLELRDGTGSLIFSNDDWRSTQEQQIIDAGVPPTDDRESAMVANVNPGNYTAIVRGKDNSTGVALVEVYTLQ